MKMNLQTLQKNTKVSYISSQSWIQVRNISVRSTSGGLRYYQKIQRELEESRREFPLTGQNNKEVQLLVESKGRSNYKREILRLCETKGEMSYYEAKLQFENDVLLKDDYYNEFVGCKIHSRHLPKHLRITTKID
jgi:hypothetical protein